MIENKTERWGDWRVSSLCLHGILKSLDSRVTWRKLESRSSDPAESKNWSEQKLKEADVSLKAHGIETVEKFNKVTEPRCCEFRIRLETNGNRQAELLSSYYTPAIRDEEVGLQPRKSRAKTCKRKLKLKIGELIVWERRAALSEFRSSDQCEFCSGSVRVLANCLSFLSSGAEESYYSWCLY